MYTISYCHSDTTSQLFINNGGSIVRILQFSESKNKTSTIQHLQMRQFVFLTSQHSTFTGGQFFVSLYFAYFPTYFSFGQPTSIIPLLYSAERWLFI